MKNLIGSLLVAVTLLPAAQIKQVETQRGFDELSQVTAKSIDEAQKHNKGHVFISYKQFNLAQAYALQRQLQALGYVVDITPSTIAVSW